MSESFKLEIISPDKILLQSDVKQVSIPGYEGSMTVLKDHIPLVTFMRPGFVNVDTKDSKFEKFYVEDGTVEFYENILLILSPTIVNIKEFNKEKVDNLIREAQEEIEKEEISDKIKYILSYKIETLKEINL